MTGNDADAQDATQEALLAIVRGLPRFDGRSKFTTWAYRVTTNACVDELRRRRRRPDPVDEIFEEPDVGGAPGIDQYVSDRLALDAALAELPTEYRAAIVLRDVLGLDYAEIGDVLDIAPGTVRSRISRGRSGLAKKLGNQSPSASVPSETP